MSSRRKFVIQGTMASMALIAARPLKALAGPIDFTRKICGPGPFVLVHTSTLSEWRHARELRFIREQRNALLVKTTAGSGADLPYDAVLPSDSAWEVHERAGNRIGVLYVLNPAELDTADERAAYLKDREGCNMVVAVSGLGFTRTNGSGDADLAAKSSQIDIVICAHPTDFPSKPRVVSNRNRAEVILQAPGENAFGRIEIQFDSEGRKREVRVQARVPRDKDA